MTEIKDGSRASGVAELKETERVEAGPGPGRGPFGGGMVGQKANSFGPSPWRLAVRLAPKWAKVSALFLLTVVSVLLPAVGPRILGRATDLFVAGVVGRKLP